MLYSQRITLDELGIPGRNGRAVHADPRTVWQIFADNYHLFLGTPTRAWLDYALYHVFDSRLKLNSESAGRIYETIQDNLNDASGRPRALFVRFSIGVLATTDDAPDAHGRAPRISKP